MNISVGEYMSQRNICFEDKYKKMWEKICFGDIFYYIRSILKYSYA